MEQSCRCISLISQLNWIQANHAHSRVAKLNNSCPHGVLQMAILIFLQRFLWVNIHFSTTRGFVYKVIIFFLFSFAHMAL